MILVVTSDEVIGKCFLRVFKKNNYDAYWSKNAIEAMDLIGKEGVPEKIFLDIMLTGPDGFTFLNEMASYKDTMEVPVILISEKDFSKFDFEAYNVIGFLDKNTMTPSEILKFAKMQITGER